jgi:hypothetical protein
VRFKIYETPFDSFARAGLPANPLVLRELLGDRFKHLSRI